MSRLDDIAREVAEQKAKNERLAREEEAVRREARAMQKAAEEALRRMHTDYIPEERLGTKQDADRAYRSVRAQKPLRLGRKEV